MIQANELRIGNIIKKRVSDEYIIVDIDTLRKVQRQLFLFKPIKLTTEILKRCGFEFLGGNQYHLSKYGLIVAECYRGFNIYAIDGYFINLKYNDAHLNHATKHGFIKYIHQLQNLVFALTGKELTINL